MSLPLSPEGRQKTDAETIRPDRLSCARAWNDQPKLPGPDEARAIASPGPTQFFRVAGGKRHDHPEPAPVPSASSAVRNLPAMTLPLLLRRVTPSHNFTCLPSPNATLLLRPPHQYSPSPQQHLILLLTALSLYPSPS
nr:hypothetical protein CFP56_75886 [Quercus suber]